MLKRFTATNYRIFKPELQFDLHRSQHYEFNGDCISEDIIRFAAVYGKNCVGKTSLLRAIYRAHQVTQQFDNDLSFHLRESEDFNFLPILTYEVEIGGHIFIYSFHKESNTYFRYEKLEIDGKVAILSNDSTKKTSDLVEYARRDETAALLRDFLGRMILVSVTDVLKEDIARGSSPYITNVSLILRQNYIEFLNKLGIDYSEIYDDQYQHTAISMALIEKIYQALVIVKPSLLLIDDFGAFWDNQLATNLLSTLIKDFKDTQFIITTQRPDLMSNVWSRPDCIFVLHDRNKILSLENSTDRELREAHNLQKIYVAGGFCQ